MASLARLKLAAASYPTASNLAAVRREIERRAQLADSRNALRLIALGRTS